MLGFNTLRSSLRDADSRIAAQQLKRHEELKARNIGAVREGLQQTAPEHLAAKIANGMQMDAAALADLESRVKKSNERRRVIEQYAPQMSRGPIKGMGIQEYLSGITAANPAVRRTGFGSMAVGGTVAAGALATENAQQLIALTSFMQQGQEQAQRAEESPLV